MNCVLCDNLCLELQGNVFKCVECEHTYVNFTGDHLSYNKSEYRVNSHGVRKNCEIIDGEITDLFHSLRDSLCEKRLSILKKYNVNGSILDIGSGGGTFALKLRREGYSVECQEISEICVDHLNKKGLKVYEGDFSSLSFPKKYDAVTCWHVLEHIKNLDVFLKKCIEICQDLLILEVPVNRRIPNPDKDWDGHFHYFSRKSVTDLFKGYFDLIEVTDDGCQKPCLLIILKRNEKN